MGCVAQMEVTGRRRVFRRPGGLVFSLITVLALVAIAVGVTAGSMRSGWRAGVLPWVVILPVAAMAVVAGVLPRMVLTPARLEVHNLFTTHIIQIDDVERLLDGRLGVAVRTRTGRTVPVVTFGRSAIADLLTGNAAARRAVAEVERVVGEHGQPAAPQAGPERRWNVPAILIMVGAVTAAATLVLLRAL